MFRTNLLTLILIFINVLWGQTYPWVEQYDSTNSLCRRIPVPEGYVRIASPPNSFAHWLQYLPLKPAKPDVFLYNGIEKGNQKAHFAVVDIDVGKTDLQQCADAVIRLRAEYLYSLQKYVDIHFNFTSGDRINFTSWIQGYRPIVKDEAVIWVQSGNKGASYKKFRDYLTRVFMYAGSMSLSEELQPVADIREVQIGDVFIQGGFPGHAVIVVDLVENPQSRQNLFLLAQSFMPAQDIHILINPDDDELNPWYSIEFGDTLATPEWTFIKGDLKRF
jgi:hypothetical protein